MNIKVDKDILLGNLRTIKNHFGKASDFYKEVGIDPSTFTYWTSDRRTPKLSSLIPICNYLGISPVDLLTKKIKIKLMTYFEEEEK